jgi:4-hydroxy-3-polyprenylbenzoate decarboxylase
MNKIVLSITGASGATLGLRFVEYLPSDVECHLIISDNAKIVLKKEHNIFTYPDHDIGAKIASGSFLFDSYIIAPCSSNTLAKVACGISDNLTTRVATVALKEQRKFLLAPREMPLNAIMIENMLKLSKLGVIISPPQLAYYSNPQSLEDMERFIIGKWYDSLGIVHNLYQRWEG